MKCKKSKLRLNEITSAMQGVYFLDKFVWVLIYILKVYRKKSSSILMRKNTFNSLLDFSLEKDVPSQVLKHFPVENVESEICLSLNY